MAYKILIVEDDANIAKSMKKQMESWGNAAKLVEDFRDVLGVFSRYAPDLVLIDIVLPFYSGYHWCSEIRKISKVPIVFISSAADNMNIVMAVNMGGDDFIAKPFDLDVLTAKVQAVLRRAYDFSPQNMMEYGGTVLNFDDATLTYRGRRMALTKNEYRILYTLLEHKGKVVSRDMLMNKLWETDSYIDENTLTVNIARLRKKLQGLGIGDFIVTKKGWGYLVE